MILELKTTSFIDWELFAELEWNEWKEKYINEWEGP